MPKGDHTREAIAARIADREDYVIMLRRAHEYAVGHDLRARKVVSMKLFPASNGTRCTTRCKAHLNS